VIPSGHQQVAQDHRHVGEACDQLLTFMRVGMPTEVAKIGREPGEAFIEKLVATESVATANNRCRALTALLKWLTSFGLDHLLPDGEHVAAQVARGPGPGARPRADQGAARHVRGQGQGHPRRSPGRRPAAAVHRQRHADLGYTRRNISRYPLPVRSLTLIALLAIIDAATGGK
jgi:hypothetical protein